VSPAQLKFLYAEMKKAEKHTTDVLEFVAGKTGKPIESLEQVPQALFDAVLAFLRAK
jgi:hypothetical protein